MPPPDGKRAKKKVRRRGPGASQRPSRWTTSVTMGIREGWRLAAGGWRPPRGLGMLPTLVVAAVLALSGNTFPAQDSASGTRIESKPAGSPIEKIVEDRVVRAAVDRGIKFLRRNQHDSGAIGDSYEVAVTSLAGLAILGAGYPFHQGPPHARETL